MPPIAMDQPPALWIPPKPAIIRSAADLNRHERRLLSKLGVKTEQAVVPGITAILAAGGGASVTYQTTQDKAETSSATLTFSGLVYKGGTVIVGYSDADTSVTMTGGAVPLTELSFTSSLGLKLFIGTGIPTNGNIVISGRGTSSRAFVIIWTAVGLLSTTPTDTATSTATPGATTLDVSSGGFIIGIANPGNADNANVTWSGINEDVDVEMPNTPTRFYSGASKNFSAGVVGQAVGITYAASNVIGRQLCVASFR